MDVLYPQFKRHWLALPRLLRLLGTFVLNVCLAAVLTGCSKSEGTSAQPSSVESDSSGVVSGQHMAQEQGIEVDGSFKSVPAGAFEMGGKTETDLPEHSVTLKKFQISDTEVVFSDWKKTRDWARTNGYDFENAGSADSDDHPVVHVNWYDVVKWCNAKSERKGLRPCYYTSERRDLADVYKRGQKDLNLVMVDWEANGFRLPTEAEWEKAARGGRPGEKFPSSNKITTEEANFSSKGSRAVRGYASNGYGLFDMAGNAWEWCWDWHKQDNRSLDAAQDPLGSDKGARRVVRGGGWDDGAGQCSVSFHNSSWPDYTSDARGFRLVKR